MPVDRLANQTVLALAELVAACFDYHVNVGGRLAPRTRPDLLGDFLYEYEFPPTLVQFVRRIPPEAGAIKDFVLSLDIGRGQSPALGCMLQTWDEGDEVSRRILLRLARSILLFIEGDRILVRPTAHRVTRLQDYLRRDGFAFEQVSLLDDEYEISTRGKRSMSSDEATTSNDDVKADPRKVFIIHGQNQNAADEMARFVRSLGLEPIEWGTLRASLKGTPHIGKIVREGMARAHGVIALFTADEYSHIRPELAGKKEGQDLRRWQARPNVLFEAGMAYARDPERVVLVRLGDVALFSDVAGISYLSPNNDPSKDRSVLRETLKQMGCNVTEGTAWMKEGDFVSCVLPEVSTQSPFRR